MLLGIMQPYFFPYIGHFSLIHAADEWVIFDTSQYTPRSWMNRNRVLHPAEGWSWLSVPLANGSIHIRTCEARLLDPGGTRRRLLGQLAHYRRAPFFGVVCRMVAEVFDEEDASLAALNGRALQVVCGYLGLAFRARMCSGLALDLPERMAPGAWAPAICRALGASGYVNPAGGRGLFKPSDFGGLSLRFLQARPFRFERANGQMEEELSILDALMWNPPERVLAAVENYTVERVC